MPETYGPWAAIIADLRVFFENPDSDEARQDAADALDRADLLLAEIGELEN